MKRALEVIEMEIECAEQRGICDGKSCEICAFGQYSINEKIDALKRAYKELKRNTKRKPIKIPYASGEGYSYRCPSQCKKFGGYVCVSEYQNYCSNCGQEIDWS